MSLPPWVGLSSAYENKLRTEELKKMHSASIVRPLQLVYSTFIRREHIYKQRKEPITKICYQSEAYSIGTADGAHYSAASRII